MQTSYRFILSIDVVDIRLDWQTMSRVMKWSVYTIVGLSADSSMWRIF